MLGSNAQSYLQERYPSAFGIKTQLIIPKTETVYSHVKQVPVYYNEPIHYQVPQSNYRLSQSVIQKPISVLNSSVVHKTNNLTSSIVHPNNVFLKSISNQQRIPAQTYYSQSFIR